MIGTTVNEHKKKLHRYWTMTKDSIPFLKQKKIGIWYHLENKYLFKLTKKLLKNNVIVSSP